MEMFKDKEKELLKQYGDYMKSAGLYSYYGDNCWRFKYGEKEYDSFWVVDLYCEHKFRPRIYKFKWKFDGINDPVLIAIQNCSGFNTYYEPKTFDEFKKLIDKTVSKFGEYKKYKKQMLENKRIKNMQSDFI